MTTEERKQAILEGGADRRAGRVRPWREVMTTETESIAALHLWLATKMPELQQKCAGNDLRDAPAHHGNRYEHAGGGDCGCGGRGWLPNVTTDALLEALPHAWRITYNYDNIEIRRGPSLDSVILAGVKGRDNEALCRAARKALETAS